MFTLNVDNEIELALVQESFAPLYVELVAEHKAYLSQWLAWPDFCSSEQDFRLFAHRSLHDYADGKSLTCAIFFHGDLVGNIGLHEINLELGRTCIGYWLAESHKGKGIVTRAAQTLIKHAFDTLGLEKVQLQAAKENLASRAVAERLGMTLEGIITRNEKVQDRVLDHAIYGLHKHACQ